MIDLIDCNLAESENLPLKSMRVSSFFKFNSKTCIGAST